MGKIYKEGFKPNINTGLNVKITGKSSPLVIDYLKSISNIKQAFIKFNASKELI